MTDIAQLGIQVDTKTAVNAAKELDALTVSAGRADIATDKLANTSGRKMAPAMSAGGQQSRMMAMQLSQVAQQASATGNFVQALAIQLPDMALGFGTVGIAAGVLASVALPALVSMFGSTTDEAKALADAVNEFGSAADAYISAVEAAGISTDELTSKYGRLAVEARVALQAMTDVALVDAMNQADVAIQQVLDSLTAYREFAGSDLFSATESVLTLKDAFDLTQQEAGRLRQALEDLDSAQGLSAQARAAAEVQRAILAAYGSVERMPVPLRNAYSAMAQIVAKGGEIETKVDGIRALLEAAARAAGSASAAVSGIGTAASNAYGAVSDLVDKMWEMAAAKAGAEAPGGLARMGEDGRGSQRGTVRGSRTVMPDQPWMNKGGGGGGGGSDPYADSLNALIENLRTEREIEDEWYAENLAILQDQRAEEIMGKQAHDQALIDLHQEYQNRIAEIDAEAQQQRIGDTANLFGALAGIAQAGGQRLAKAAATFQAIEGTVNAYGAAIKALNTPGITLAGRFAAYASVLGAGLKGVAAIRSAGGIGGGGGGAVAAQGATTATSQRASELIINVPGNALLTGDMWSQIFEGVIGEAKARGSNLFSNVRFAT